MVKPNLKLHLAAAALMLSGLSFPVTGASMHEHAAIQSAIDAMTAAFAARDIEGILAAYEPGAVVVGEPGVPSAGAAELTELFTRFIAVDPQFTFLDHEIVQAGDIALHFSTWRMQGRMPDGSPVEDGGLSVVVLRRQADGSWRMVIDDPYGDRLLHR